jgi:acyl carrier protein
MRDEVAVGVRHVVDVVLEARFGNDAEAHGSWDSLDLINIVFGLEEAFGIEFGENENWGRFATLDGLIDATEERLAVLRTDSVSQ